MLYSAALYGMVKTMPVRENMEKLEMSGKIKALEMPGKKENVRENPMIWFWYLVREK